MFKVDRALNRLQRLDRKKFTELGISERGHLQEWLAHMPGVLGEELLIIQKEFDGFEETRERLDLLALDKEGRLVLIENKLDDTGRDVVWQAIKYAAYVSTLTKAQIVDIFQMYLDRHLGGGNAAAAISDFLEADDLEEVVLNSGNSQRIILIAANFRKEVTAASLWLLGRGLDVQCFKVTAYVSDENVLIDLQQIIPVPEAEEFMIGVSSKETEEKSAYGEQKTRHVRRHEFWTAMLEHLKHDGFALYQNVGPSRDHWLSAGSGVAGCTFNLIFGKAEARVELYFAKPEAKENKALFDALEKRKVEIEQAFGAPLIWQRLGEKKACRISYAKAFDGYQKENWPAIISWLAENIQRLDAAFKRPLISVNQSLRGKVAGA